MKEQTKLRFISAKEPEMITAALMNLGFKVEIKSIYYDGKKHICWFTVRDGDQIGNLEL